MGRASGRGSLLAPAELPALDGLRALAVAAVLAFHGGVGAVGGALGVSLFLVLSGFLITRLLLGELDEHERVDLVAFWGRRVRRLFPALLVVVLAVMAVEATGLLDSGYTVDALRGDALTTLGYVSNWHFAAEGSGYFAAFSAPSPLRHTWSLAVEGQWYLVWPVVLLAVRRAVSHRALPTLAVIAALTAASTTAMWQVAGDVDRAHYGTDARAGELLVGAALAVLLHHRPLASWTPRARTLLAASGWVGAAVVAWMVLDVAGTTAWLYRGGHLVFALAVATLTAACQIQGSRLAWLLSVRWLRGLGSISYGLYLWHWPIFIWLLPGRVGIDGWPLFAVRVAASVVAAVVSYRVIEQPVRRQRVRLARPVLAGIGASAVCGVLVVTMAAVAPPSSRIDVLAGARPAVPASIDPEHLPVADVRAVTAAGPAALARSVNGGDDDGQFEVLVVGDSTAWTLAESAEPPPGVRIRNGGVLGCGVHPARMHANGAELPSRGTPVPCERTADYWTALAGNGDPDVILVAIGAWEVYDRVLDDGTHLTVGTPEWSAWLAEHLEFTGWRLALAAEHARFVVAEVPCYVERSTWLGGDASPRNDPARGEAVNAVLRDVVGGYPERAEMLPMHDLLCPDGPEPRIDGWPVRPDGVHVAGEGGARLWDEHLLPRLRAIAREAPAAQQEG